MDVIAICNDHATVTKHRLKGKEERVLPKAVELCAKGATLTRPALRGDDSRRLTSAPNIKLSGLAVERVGPVPQPRKVTGNHR